MRLGIIATMGGSPWGGSELLWHTAANRALDQQVSVAVSSHAWESLPEPIQQLRARGADCTMRLSKPAHGQRSRFRALARRQTATPHPLLSDLESFRPDVLCVSSGGTYDILYDSELLQALYRISRGLRCPYATISHWNDDAYILEESLRPEAIQYFARSSANYFVSRENVRTAERQIAHSIPRVQIVQNPVKVDPKEILAWPSSDGALLACVARLEVRTKGQDLLLEALSDPVWSSRDWRLNLYGIGPDSNYLKDLTRYLGLSDRVTFRGYVDDVHQIWMDNHLLVLSSRSEGTPISLVEAMLCGRPAVVTAVGGSQEYIVDARSGYIAPAPAAAQISAALDRAWQDRLRWPEMGASARQVALERFHPDPGLTFLRELTNLVIV